MLRLEKQADPSPGGLKLEDLPCDSQILEPARRAIVCCPSDFRPSLDHPAVPTLVIAEEAAPSCLCKEAGGVDGGKG
jgi:hypothetical protein